MDSGDWRGFVGGENRWVENTRTPAITDINFPVCIREQNILLRGAKLNSGMRPLLGGEANWRVPKGWSTWA